MPRQVTHGTPSLSPRYIRPRHSRIVFWSALGALGLFVAIAIAFAVGTVRPSSGLLAVASPGSVAAGHASAGIDTSCAQCHEPAKTASDLRCERCHDPIDTHRYENSGHALVSGGRAWHAINMPEPVACATCHTEHRGHSRPLATVDDRRCATCHSFAAFNRHPEFAVVRAGRGPNASMDFSHVVHLREITRTGGERCTSCHVQTADQRGFEPLAFDTHCARCHVKDRVLTLNGTDLLTSGFATEELLLKGTQEAPAPAFSPKDGRGRVTFQTGHRDAWVLANADRLSRTLEGDAIAAERSRLQTRQQRLAAIVNAAPLALQADRDLSLWRDELRASVKAPRAAAGESAGDGSLSGLEASLAGLAAQTSMPPATLGGASAAAMDAKSLQESKDEIQQLLAAIEARARGPLADRAAVLRKQLASIKVDKPAASVDGAALAQRLADADSALNAIAPIMAREDAAAMAEARDIVRRQLTGSIDQATYDARKRQLAAAVDQLAARGDASQRARVAELRGAVAALPEHVFGPSAINRDRDRARLLNRIDIELSLRTERGLPAAMATTNIERAEARRQLAVVTARLAELDAGGAILPGSEAGRAKSTLRGLLGACLQCHRLNADETAMRQTSLPAPVMPDATYSHKPHILQAQCETCHTTVQVSRSGTDANMPGVAVCQTCHTPSQAKAGCNECHTYHARSSADLIMALR